MANNVISLVIDRSHQVVWTLIGEVGGNAICRQEKYATGNSAFVRITRRSNDKNYLYWNCFRANVLGCFEHPQVEHDASFLLDEGNISVTIPCLLKGLFEFAFPNQLQCPHLKASAGWEVGVE